MVRLSFQVCPTDTMVSVAEAGWYPLPSDPSKVMYYDGAQWVGTPVPAPAVPVVATTPAPTGPVGIEALWERAKDIAKDEEHQGTALAIAGGAAIADGVVGIGKRPGIGRSIAAILFGVVFGVISTMMLNLFASQAASVAPPLQDAEVASTVVVSTLTYDADGFCTPTAVVEGIEVQVRMPIRSSPCPLVAGESIEVFHVPGAPQSARLSPASLAETSGSLSGFIDLFRWVFLGAAAFMVISGVLSLLGKLGVIAGGGILMWLGLKRRREAREAKE